MKIILASGSPRRRELLAQAGYAFTVEVSDADEDITAQSPDRLVEDLSYRKAMAVVMAHGIEAGSGIQDPFPDKDLDTEIIAPEDEDLLFIGADTVVVLSDEIHGKPEDEADAARMLTELSGRTHQVYTGVCLIHTRGRHLLERRTFSECTDVIMRKLSAKEIHDYIASGEPMDKAGAYGIQGKAAVFISGIRGDYYNVVGLPVCHLAEEINRITSEY